MCTGHDAIFCYASENTKINRLIDWITLIQFKTHRRGVVQCIDPYYPFNVVTFTLHYIPVCLYFCFFLNLDIQILQIKMCQKLQEEEKPKENKMDQSFQKGVRKGADSGEMIDYKSAIAERFFWYCWSKHVFTFRITRLSLRNADTHLLNTTGTSGKRQVMCPWSVLGNCCFVTWLFY